MSFYRSAPSWGQLEAPGLCEIAHQVDRLWVNRADPRIWMSTGLLERLQAGDSHPDVTATAETVTVDAVNQRVVYRIMRRHPTLDVWELQWPD